jgi:UDP-N-acetylglucosamine 2-epimerase (non-hydrolysing)
LIGPKPSIIKPTLDKLFARKWKEGGIPAMWDEKATGRIAELLIK